MRSARRVAVAALVMLAVACSSGDGDAPADTTEPSVSRVPPPTTGVGSTVDGSIPATTPPPVERTTDNPADPPRALLDWSMPARYDASWEAWQPLATYPLGGGSVDEEARFGYDPAFVTPATWSVDLDACSSPAGGAPIRSFRWDVFRAGELVMVAESDTCRTRVEVPELGEYEVTLTVADTDQRSAIVTETVSVRDLLVVSVGDSIGAGEGNPDPGSPDQGTWISSRCHRSRTSGHALAAQALEDADPRTSVTYVNVACSGARIDRGVLGPYSGIDSAAPDGPGPTGAPNTLPLEPQLDAVLRALCADQALAPCPEPGARTVDVLLVSVGVNATGFASVVADCADPTVASCAEGATADRVDRGLEVLAGSVGPTTCRSAQQRIESGEPVAEAVADATAECDTVGGSYATLTARLVELGVAPQHTYIVAYPAHLFGPPEDPTAGGCDALGGITADEADFMARRGDELNELIEAVAETAGWNLVGGATGAFTGHAYCDDPSWFVGAFESLANQGGFEGAAHPNAAGHAALADLIVDVVRTD